MNYPPEQIKGPNNTEYTTSSGSFESTGSINQLGTVGQPRGPDEQHTFLEQFTATLKRYGPEFMDARYATVMAFTGRDAEPFYDPFKNLEPQYYPYASLIGQAKSDFDSNLLKTYIDTVAEEKALANENIWVNLLGTLIASGFSPLATGASMQAARLTDYLIGPAHSLAGIAGRGFVSGALMDIPLEVSMMQTDPQYKLDEAWTGVALSALGSAAFDMAYFGPELARNHPANGSFTSASRAQPVVHDLVQSLEDGINPPKRVTKPSISDPIQYSKAVEDVKLVTPDGFVTKPIFNFFVGGKGTYMQPSLAARLLSSPSAETRSIANDLMEHNFTLEGHKQGLNINPSVESIVNANKIKSIAQLDDVLVNSYGMHKKAGGELSLDAFEEAVAKAVRRGGKSDIPHVKEAATFYSDLMNEYMEKYKKAGIFSEDFVAPKKGENYFTRVYNRDAIIENMQAWRSLLTSHMDKGILEELEREIVSKRKPIDDLPDIPDKKPKLTPEERKIVQKKFASESAAAVERVTQKILGSQYFDLDNLNWTDANAKVRTIHIPDVKLEPFLKNDIRNVARLYIERAEKDLALTERFGTTNKEIILSRVEHDYRDKMTAGLKSPEEMQALQERMKNDLQELDVVFDRLYGVRGLPKDPLAFGSQVFKGMSSFNSIRLLGSVMISQLPEFFRGLINRFTQNVVARDFENMGKAFDKINLSPDDLRFLGAHLGNAQRIMHLIQGDVDLPAQLKADGVVTTGLRHASEVFARVSGMELMDNFTRSGLAVTAARYFYNYSKRLLAKEHIPEGEMTWLAQHGITPERAKEIVRQAEKHGEDVDGAFYLNAHQWEGKTGEIMRTAIRKYVNTYLINPGIADRFPFADVNGLAKLFMQFRSYSQGAFARAFLPGLQDNEIRLLGLVIMMLGVGYLINRAISAADPNTYAKNAPTTHQTVSDVVARAGVIPYLFDLYSTGLNTFAGGGTTRQQTQGRLDTLLGPTAGLISRQVPALGRFVMNEMEPGDVRALKQLVPFNNIIWWNWYLNKHAQMKADEIRHERSDRTTYIGG